MQRWAWVQKNRHGCAYVSCLNFFSKFLHAKLTNEARKKIIVSMFFTMEATIRETHVSCAIYIKMRQRVVKGKMQIGIGNAFQPKGNKINTRSSQVLITLFENF